jgi:hypothetical protein
MNINPNLLALVILTYQAVLILYGFARGWREGVELEHQANLLEDQAPLDPPPLEDPIHQGQELVQPVAEPLMDADQELEEDRQAKEMTKMINQAWYTERFQPDTGLDISLHRTSRHLNPSARRRRSGSPQTTQLKC